MDKNNRHRSQFVARPGQYNNSSEAYDYGYARPSTFERTLPDFDEINRRLHDKKQEELKKKALLKKQRAIMMKKREEVRKDRINHILCYFLAVYILAIGVFILNQFDRNNLIKSQISAKQAIINDQGKQISSKQITLASSIDIHEIERIAKEELGMKNPSTDQLVYVSLPKNRSYIEYSKPSTSNNEKLKNKDLQIDKNKIGNSKADSSKTEGSTTDGTEKAPTTDMSSDSAGQNPVNSDNDATNSNETQNNQDTSTEMKNSTN